MRTALSEDAEAAQSAIEEIAGAMQLFLASDVIYETRTFQFIQDELAEAEVGGQTIQRTEFFPGIEWLDPTRSPRRSASRCRRAAATARAASRRRASTARGSTPCASAT